MLDSETKKRIDYLRDILVGKVPSPESQVEQITTGLIYKFMYDMDVEAVEMGGVPSFFVKDYEKYSWKHLFDPKLGGADKVQLYSDAIENMYTNPSAPQLFREIFKNSFLPFKDPSTLNMFLKEINEFHYSHSEKLGDAFEYLLSFMGSQGDAGQFRTPRHIIDFIVEIVNPQKNETILDPACGTAGFLISSYKHILSQNTDKKLGDKLNASERKQVSDNLVGYDISPDMTRISLVNMYLHQFASPQIHEYDTLSSEDRWNEYYNVILANPPFFSPTGGIKPHTRFGVQSTRAEVLFVDYIIEHLKPTGRAGIVVPEGIIFQTGNAYKTLRKKLIEDCLVGVISLPVGVFQPYSGVKTSILVLDKELNQKSDSIFFAKVENDGFSLGAQRTPIKGNQLPEISVNISKYLIGNDEDTLTTVSKGKILDESGVSLNATVYAEIEAYQSSSFKTYELGEICEFINGAAFKPSDWVEEDEETLPIVRIQNLNNKNAPTNHTKKSVAEKYLIEDGQLLFSWSGSKETSFGAHIWSGSTALLNQHIFKVVFDHRQVLKPYLFYALNKCVEEVKTNLHGGVGLVHITKGNLEKIRFPLPPIEVQQQIVDELEGYQNIIDGCRQVVENYKPTIEIEPSWEMVELGKVCDFVGGTQPPKSTFVHEEQEGYIRLIQTRDYKSDKFKVYIPTTERHKTCNSTDIMIGRYGPPVFQILRGLSGAYNVALMKCLPDKEKILEDWLFYVLKSQPVQTRIISLSERVRQSGVRPDDLKTQKIPLPPLEIQQRVVDELGGYQKIIDGNRSLIQIYTQKIQDRISKVWGE